MPTINILKADAVSCIDRLIQIDSEYHSLRFSNVSILNASIEYVFLEGYKCWENFTEDIFVAYARYNQPISGITPSPYLIPKDESHALDLLKLEKDYLDWTSPGAVIDRAMICFENHNLITDHLKLAIQDLRDAKKLRNCITHGSKESYRIFTTLCRNNVGVAPISPGEYLNKTSPDKVNHYNVYYLNLFKNLILRMT